MHSLGILSYLLSNEASATWLFESIRFDKLIDTLCLRNSNSQISAIGVTDEYLVSLLLFCQHNNKLK